MTRSRPYKREWRRLNTARIREQWSCWPAEGCGSGKITKWSGYHKPQRVFAMTFVHLLETCCSTCLYLWELCCFWSGNFPRLFHRTARMLACCNSAQGFNSRIRKRTNCQKQRGRKGGGRSYSNVLVTSPVGEMWPKLKGWKLEVTWYQERWMYFGLEICIFGIF